MASPVQFELHDHIDGIDAGAWDALGDGHPATSHVFLRALEASGCVAGDSGWLPRHLIGRSEGKVVAAVPLYLKTHSYGEYVFDWAWADAYHQHGLEYYPKWLVASPFSPLPGTRILARSPQTQLAAIEALRSLAAESGLSSMHVLFCTATEAQSLASAGMLLREGVQFHWIHRGERDFAAFLARLNHDKRKKIRQERRKLEALGLDYRWHDGTSAAAADWDFFLGCYEDTYAAHRSTPYLNRDFFDRIASDAPNRMRLLIASRGGQPLASAYFLVANGALYGRYWGARESVPGLHFELCYYQPIEYCLAHGLRRMEGGAQGEHKMARGLEPITTYSAHWIADRRFHDALQRHLALEGRHVDAYRGELERRTPFRR
ncbi:MAG: N-acetyltransferase [Rhodocyclaceae bacterium]|nr:N-acetyltransferase [Rhodocyclaceae bacterium]